LLLQKRLNALVYLGQVQTKSNSQQERGVGKPVASNNTTTPSSPPQAPPPSPKKSKEKKGKISPYWGLKEPGN